MRPAAALFISIALQAVAQERPESEWRPAAEKRILGRLNGTPHVDLQCDFVVNSASTASIAVPVPGKMTILNIWRPSCEPCKPLLKELAALSKKAPADLVILGAAESEAPDEGAAGLATSRTRIESIVRKYAVHFPVCGYSDTAQTKKWQAEGVPLTLFFRQDGTLARVALGGGEGSRAIKQLQAGWRP